MTLLSLQSTNSKGFPPSGLPVIVDNTFPHFLANLSQVFITYSWKISIRKDSMIWIDLGESDSLSWADRDREAAS